MVEKNSMINWPQTTPHINPEDFLICSSSQYYDYDLSTNTTIYYLKGEGIELIRDTYKNRGAVGVIFLKPFMELHYLLQDDGIIQRMGDEGEEYEAYKKELKTLWKTIIDWATNPWKSEGVRLDEEFTNDESYGIAWSLVVSPKEKELYCSGTGWHNDPSFEFEFIIKNLKEAKYFLQRQDVSKWQTHPAYRED